MAKGKVIAIVVISLIITAAVSFGIVFMFTFGTVGESFEFYYKPETIQSSENLSLYSDFGNIEIKYNNTPTENVITIKVDAKLSGAFLAGRSFSEFFKEPEFLNSTSDPVKKFTFEKRSTVWFLIFSTRFNISVTLRTDIKYNISGTVLTGNIDLNIPDSSQIEDLSLKSTTGNIALTAKNSSFIDGIQVSTTTGNININLDKCYIEEKIDLLTTTGNINLKVYNLSYSQTHLWDLDVTTGNIWVLIHQNAGMNGNVTGNAQTTTGNVGFTYIDYSNQVGASFSASVTTGNFNSINNGGFIGGNTFQSNDYNSANYTYTIDLSVTTGNIDVAGNSM